MHFAALLVLSIVSAMAHAQGMPVVSGERSLGPKEARIAKLRLTGESSPQHVTLAPVSEGEVDRVRQENLRRPSHKRLVIGVNRVLPERASPSQTLESPWVGVEGGRAARLSVTSPEAGSLRLALDLEGIAEDVEMVFFGSAEPARLVGPIRVGEIGDRTRAWWSPLTEGDTQTIELFVPSRHGKSGLAVKVRGVSHVFTTPSSNFSKRLEEIGRAGSCNIDIACSSLNGSSAFRDVVQSVAQMIFNDEGFTVLCTGTLLNDNDPATQTPWFLSNNHCFDNLTAPFKSASEMQVVANTLNTLWRFEASACNSRAPDANWTQLTTGAAFLYNNVQSDALLLRLKQAAPAGAFFSGWDANPIGGGEAVLAIHHPEGDLKKASQGSVVGFAVPQVGGGNESFTEVRWSSGTTEGGSSGSGLWTFDGSEYRLRGGLWGGTASCTNTAGSDFYYRFDQVYPKVSAYLSAAAGPFADVTDLWWNPNESGWGLSLIQHSTNIVFGVWYTYNDEGKRLWVVMPTGSWSNSSTYTGPLYITSGPAYAGAFDPALVTTNPVGSATLTFTDANNGTWTYNINGQSGSKSIARQSF
jgi:lysyl endopeptidase